MPIYQKNEQFNKSKPQRERKRRETDGLISGTMALHVRYHLGTFLSRSVKTT